MGAAAAEAVIPVSLTEKKTDNPWTFAPEGSFFVESSNARLSCRVALHSDDARAVVLCHGLFCSKDHRLIKHLAKELTPNVVSFDFRGNGESSGEWNFGGYEDESEDIRSVVQFLRSKGIEVVMLAGHSRGANTVLLYATKFDDIPLVASLASRFDMSRGLAKHCSPENLFLLERDGKFSMTSPDGRKRIISKQSLDDRKNLDMKQVSQVSKSTLLFVHGTADDIIPYEDALSLKKHASSAKAEVLLLSGASHFFFESPEAMQTLVETLNGRVTLL